MRKIFSSLVAAILIGGFSFQSSAETKIGISPTGLVKEIDGVAVDLAFDAIYGGASGQSCYNVLGEVIDALEARVDYIENKQHLEAGLGSSRMSSLEELVSSQRAEIGALVSQVNAYILNYNALLAKLDLDTGVADENYGTECVEVAPIEP